MPKFNKNQYTLKQAYTFYKETTTDPVSYQEYKLILDTWGNMVVDFLIEGKDVKLHNGMSILGVRKRHKRNFVDHEKSARLGKKVFSPNLHSGFYGVSVLWKRHYTTFNSKGWAFQPSRKLNRALAKIMKQPFGHTKFVMSADFATTEAQAKKLYNKKVHGL